MVFRYSEPAGAAATQFATSLGAAAQTGTPAPGYLGTFAGRDFTVSVTASTETPVREPFFFLTPTASSTYAAQAAPSQVAGDFLASHSLAPMWPNVVSTVQVGDQATVRYLREFVAPDGGFAYLVDGLGSRYGLEVDLKGGQPVIAAGPLPLALDSAEYPIISAADAVRMALDSSAAGAAAVSPMPTVQLTSAELVYALAWSGGHGFYEPCFLFSGTFTANGVTYVKRVLVPAVAH